MMYKYFHSHLFLYMLFLFHKCANRHTLLLCQINLTWLCLHQSAGFLRRHCLHPKCVHVSYGNRKTHASCHGGYLLSICLLRRIAVYQTAQQPESLTQYFQWHIKMSRWKRKDKSCTLLDLEESMGEGKVGFKEGIFSGDQEKQLCIAFPQVYSPNLEQNAREDLGGRSIHEEQDLVFPQSIRNYRMAPITNFSTSPIKKSTE